MPKVTDQEIQDKVRYYNTIGKADGGHPRPRIGKTRKDRRNHGHTQESTSQESAKSEGKSKGGKRSKVKA